jgi:radical SAM superfamily enzyme YgiQ (UPF0313 family)
MKKILFIAVNSSWSQSNLAFYYLREVARDLPYQTQMLVFTTKEPVLQTVEEIYRHGAEVLCFSAYIWNRGYLQALLKVLRQLLPEAIFVVGGPESSAFAGTAKCFVIKGAGEAAFSALAESGFTELDNSLPCIPLAKIPFPYRTEDKDELEDHLVYYECYRGCPYGCVYCLSANDRRNESRFDMAVAEDRERLREELDALIALKPRTLKFIDRSFNLNKALAHYIWEYAMRDESGTDFHFEIYPDLLDEADLQLLDKAPLGKIRFEIGIQTINTEVAAMCGRKSDWSKSRKVLLRLKEAGRIRVHTDLLAGLPGEDISSVMRSLDALCACEPAVVQLGMLKILPDTPMREIARQRCYIWMEDPPYQVLRSDAMSYGELCLLDDYAHLLSLYWNKEEFGEEWHLLLQEHSATEILAKLKEIHEAQGLALHSVSKGKRMSVFEVVSG